MQTAQVAQATSHATLVLCRVHKRPPARYNLQVAKCWEHNFLPMDELRWTSFDLIFFDCDSTLSAIEGIDELARFKGKEWRVGILTEKAMNGDLDLAEVYGKRLQAIRPTRGQLKAIE